MTEVNEYYSRNLLFKCRRCGTERYIGYNRDDLSAKIKRLLTFEDTEYHKCWENVSGIMDFVGIHYGDLKDERGDFG